RDEELNPIKAYWIGVYEFREGDFPAAQNHFKLAAAVSNDPRLKDLSYLMEARCVFWPQRSLLRLQAGAEARLSMVHLMEGAVGELRQLQASINDSSYKKDVEHYIDELERLRA